MDLVLNTADHYILTPHVYPTWWKEDDVTRQLISLFAIVNIGGYIMYLSLATLSFFFVFDRRLLKHPKILKDQVKLEIMYTCSSIPLMAVPTVALFLLEVRGYSKLYDSVDNKLGYAGIVISAFTFILFTDACIYWIHRFLHHKLVYKHVHKPHHKWLVPTPFASHAFHPLDGFLQSCPYHIYPFLFPLHKGLYLCLFVFVNIWTVSIHDGDYRVPDVLKPFINGSAHHTDHHLFYNYNYGQFFTLWDRIGGSFRWPSSFNGEGPANAVEELDKSAAQNGHTPQNGHLDPKKKN
ncbi:lathosterol oxidase-like [Mercenaria mercenaria]|uniref:lathosterol oxidase-like n=1 Tax=Mercenaria mercenaria TaxID=6596 RepID=UPI00234E6465|nr:lathosterol oxidase-like [Mercenaria mercenaria]XP_053409200.1 lathosterol oxidase-like [Mercenaria mercenaria]